MSHHIALYYMYSIGWSFKRRNGHSQIGCGPKFQNFTIKCQFLTWRSASENFDCQAKIAKTILFFIAMVFEAKEGICNEGAPKLTDFPEFNL